MGHFNISKQNLEVFCKKWKIKTIYLFGSALRPDFDPKTSDFDIMIEFHSPADWSLFDHFEMQEEFVILAGRAVDLLTKRSVERSHNHIRKNEILNTAKVVYESAA
jgi:predicted nucleotidyltransferase